jgi:N-acetyl-anhydromuramyl-L-alanine amidase AmpD
VYETLRARKGPRTSDGLSIHYVVGSDGEVVQMASHDRVCLHAGVANEWSVGIEVVNPGFPKGRAYEREIAAGVKREIYEDYLKSTSRTTRMLDFTAAQTASVIALCERLCDELGIERKVPLETEIARGVPLDCDLLIQREMTADELSAFGGVLGHYHCHPSKMDPGTRIFDALHARWA